MKIHLNGLRLWTILTLTKQRDVSYLVTMQCRIYSTTREIVSFPWTRNSYLQSWPWNVTISRLLNYRCLLYTFTNNFQHWMCELFKLHKFSHFRSATVIWQPFASLGHNKSLSAQPLGIRLLKFTQFSWATVELGWKYDKGCEDIYKCHVYLFWVTIVLFQNKSTPKNSQDYWVSLLTNQI